MGTIINITDATRSNFLQAVTEFFDYRSTPSTLSYPPITVPCPSCSENYNDDGTTFNSFSDCSACGGIGNYVSISTDVINMVVYTSPAQWKKLNISNLMDLRVPAGSVLIRGKIADLIKLRQAEKVVFNTDMTNIQGGTYKLYGEPIDENRLNRGNFFWAFLARDETS